MDYHGINRTPRDRVLRAWENSTELVRDFENYKEILKDDKELSDMFAEFAEDEGEHAAKLLKILQSYENN